MSNLEVEPQERVCEDEPTEGGIILLESRDVPLGGIRAMTVRRTLPQRGRSFIGAWCFADHYGPDEVDATGGMTVPPHPHTGLQTVSWLFAGEIEHRDSTGAHAMVRPGEVNLMTAGAGIQHSEVSTPATRMLHGVQLWTVLPDTARFAAPFFENYVPPVIDHQGAKVRVFAGSLLGQRSDVTIFSPLVGAQLDLPSNTEIVLPVEAGFEHGILVDDGDVTMDDVTVPRNHIGYRAPGPTELAIASGDTPARIVLLGGEPFGESIIMWWNFIGRSHDEVVAYREQWQREIIGAAPAGAGTDAGLTPDGRFGSTIYDGPALPAPALPGVRLKPRD